MPPGQPPEIDQRKPNELPVLDLPCDRQALRKPGARRFVITLAAGQIAKIDQPTAHVREISSIPREAQPFLQEHPRLAEVTAQAG